MSLSHEMHATNYQAVSVMVSRKAPRGASCTGDAVGGRDRQDGAVGAQDGTAGTLIRWHASSRAFVREHDEQVFC